MQGQDIWFQWDIWILEIGQRFRWGCKFGYALLTVIMLSNLMAILIQSLCVRLGVATGRDLAQACRDYLVRRCKLLVMGTV